MFQLRNLVHGRESRVKRVLRPGGRQTKFLLEDGSKISRAGKRSRAVGAAVIKANLDKIVQGVEEGFISVSDSDGNFLSGDELHKMFSADKEVKPQAPEVEDKSEPDPEATPEPEEEEEENDLEEMSEEKLEAMSRKDLNDMAEKRGLNPANYSNKAKIITALLET